jgi:hypothetical protein
MSVSFNAWGNRGTRRTPSPCRKSLKKCIIYSCIEYTLPWAGFEFIALVVIGTDCTCSGISNYQLITAATPLDPYWWTYDVKCLPNRVVWLVWKSTCHIMLNKTRTLQYNICLSFPITLRKSKINIAISVSQIMCSIQTAINHIHFILLFFFWRKEYSVVNWAFLLRLL